MRSFFVYLCLAVSLTFLVACGSSSNSNNANNTSPTPPLSGANGSGSGSAGSGSGNGGSGSSGSGSGSSSSSVSYVYTASTSTIMGYGVKSDGSLTALTGSPFAASLAQGSNIVTNGANIYAIAQGQRNLDIFSIDKSSGALNLVNGAAGGTSGDPNWTLALDHTGASLYVGVGIPDETDSISGFTVGSGPDAQHFESLVTGAFVPPPLVFSSDNQYAYSDTCFFRSEGIFAYTRASDGTLKGLNLGPVTEPTVTGAAFCPGALAVSAKGYLAVVWVRDFMCCGSSENHVYVETYKINSDGTLTAISGSQQQTASTADSSSANTVAANFDPSGNVLAMTGNGGIQTYSLNGNGVLAPAGSPQNAGVKFQSVAWDNSNHMFATDSSQLYVFNSSSGMLSPASGSPHAGGQALTVLPLQ